MLTRGAGYQETYDTFRWQIPATFNIGVACSDAHADGSGRPALIIEHADGAVRTCSFDELARLSNKLANLLVAEGIRPGDRVGILLPQRLETALAHLAVYKMGAIALPLFTQFGPDALEHRLADSGTRALVTDADNVAKVAGLRDRLPDLARILLVDDGGGGHVDFWAGLERADDAFAPVTSGSDDPALILYTSGTTGKPKGALHAQRVLLGHLPGVQLPHEFFPQPGDRFWTPADWAWAGGLLDVLLPSLYFGVPVVAHTGRRSRPGVEHRKFDPERAFDLIARHGIRNSFLPPTALKLMRQVARPADRWRLAMRSIGSGGEALGEDMLDWGRATFGLTINEFYGQTEANLVVSNCASLFPVVAGSMGRTVPGHVVEVVGRDGMPVAAGETGNIAVRRGDPVVMLEYWRNPDATREKYAEDWLLTGDMGVKDGDGRFWFKGRADDLISSGGYRIGPTDIEDTILKHPAVLMVAVIGAPDPVRGEIVKAFVLPRPGVATGPELAAEIQAFVRERLAAYQYPREVEFVAELPLTATGKIRRKDLREREAARRSG